MENIKITTTQNVDLEYVSAGVGYRILASLLDSIFQVVYFLLFVFLFGYIGSGFDYMERDYFTLTLFIIFMLPLLLYHFLSELLMNGQSLGKKIVGIKVVK